MSDLIPIERIENKILVIRDERVLLDRDLAELYEVPTKALKQAVRRNITRFPKDFMFELNKEEFKNWRSQFATSNSDKMGLRYAPMVFTEPGVAMLSSVLKSERAIQMNVAIIRTFINMRKMIRDDEFTKVRLNDIEDRLGANEFQVFTMMDQIGTIKKKLIPAKSNKPKIGFHSSKKDTSKKDN
jgi:hypothetical protein